MSEISIKIKGPISRVVKTKKKAKARTGKPKTKTDAYLEKLKGREYSYNTSPFYDYKAGLQPTYIYRQQTIPQLQQDSKHTELIKYLEDMKKSNRELQTGKLTHKDPSPDPYSVDEPNGDEQKTISGVILEDITKQEALKQLLILKELKESLKESLKNIGPQLSNAKADLETALKRENEGRTHHLANSSSTWQVQVNTLETKKKALETQIKELETQIATQIANFK